MHISEGVLPGWLLATSWRLTAVGTYLGLRKIDNRKLPLVALLSAVFFIASLIHIPLGPTSVHLLMNGLAGLLLGWAAFPALLVALFFQAIFFQFGGLTVLGVNTFNMAFPAVLAFYITKPLRGKLNKPIYLILTAVIAATVAVFGAGILVAVELYLTGEAFKETAELVIFAHIPVAVIEAIVYTFVLLYLKKVHPELLEGIK
jgi:cobalt/nickel transport system permease protein